MKQIVLVMALLFCGSGALAQAGRHLVREGVELHDQGRYDQALIKYQEALRADPDYLTAWYELALTQFETGHYQEAMATVRKALDKNLRDDEKVLPGLYNVLASCYQETGQPREALAAYDEGIDRCGPRYTGIMYLLYYNKGLFLIRQKQSDAALRLLLLSAYDNPMHTQTHFLLEQLLRQSNRIPEAVFSALVFMLRESNTERTLTVYRDLRELPYRYIDTGEQVVLYIPEPNSSEIATTALLMAFAAQGQWPVYLEDDLLYEQFKAIYTSFVTMCRIVKEAADRDEPDRSLDPVYADKLLPFFLKIDDRGYSDVFCRFITASVIRESGDWMENNQWEFEKFRLWLGTVRVE